MRSSQWSPFAALCAAAVLTPAALAGPPASTYVADFVSTAASGVAMNGAGDVIGTSYTDTGCGSFCLPPQETVVWKNGVRTVLPTVPGLSGITVRGINAYGWIAGYAGLNGTTTHAVVWKPNGAGYTAIDLGTLPGTTISSAIGIDDQGRVVGFCSTLSFPPTSAPFLWTEAGGMVNLVSQGYPADAPLAMSNGGMVATWNASYSLSSPASVTYLPAAPSGFQLVADTPAINDDGEQARWLATTTSQALRYLFRFQHATGTWQQVSFLGNGNLQPYGIGSINASGDITATEGGAARIAWGPTGLAESLAPYVSGAYKGAVLSFAGTQNSEGQILAQMFIGNSPRLVRLTPADPCLASCLRVSTIQFGARFVQDPRFPGQCFQGGRMYNAAKANVTVTNEAGVKQSGAVVTARFLDDYWTNAVVTGTTNSKGAVTFSFKGLCGTGAIGFVVDSVVKGVSSFDRTIGTLVASAIPAAAPAGADGPSLLADMAPATDMPEVAASALTLVAPVADAGRTVLSFTLPDACGASLRLYDTQGALVATLADGPHAAGRHTLEWRQTMTGGQRAPRGVYWARLDACGESPAPRSRSCASHRTRRRTRGGGGELRALRRSALQSAPSDAADALQSSPLPDTPRKRIVDELSAPQCIGHSGRACRDARTPHSWRRSCILPPHASSRPPAHSSARWRRLLSPRCPTSRRSNAPCCSPRSRAKHASSRHRRSTRTATWRQASASPRRKGRPSRRASPPARTFARTSSTPGHCRRPASCSPMAASRPAIFPAGRPPVRPVRAARHCAARR